jgi:hypothetical protein
VDDAAAVLMQSSPQIRLGVKLGIAMLLGVSAIAQDVKLNVTDVCSRERLYVESCNIRDLSDAATCQVAHPDCPKHNGFIAYTSDPWKSNAGGCRIRGHHRSTIGRRGWAAGHPVDRAHHFLKQAYGF